MRCHDCRCWRRERERKVLDVAPSLASVRDEREKKEKRKDKKVEREERDALPSPSIAKAQSVWRKGHCLEREKTLVVQTCKQKPKTNNTLRASSS